MAATHTDRDRLAELPEFVAKVTGAVYVVANTVGAEAASATARMEKRTTLVNRALAQPDVVGAMFARAAAGNTAIGNTFADTAGTDAVKIAAITDATLTTFVAGAWDVLASVLPVERGA